MPPFAALVAVGVGEAVLTGVGLIAPRVGVEVNAGCVGTAVKVGVTTRVDVYVTPGSGLAVALAVELAVELAVALIAGLADMDGEAVRLAFKVGVPVSVGVVEAVRVGDRVRAAVEEGIIEGVYVGARLGVTLAVLALLVNP